MLPAVETGGCDIRKQVSRGRARRFREDWTGMVLPTGK